jgi:hypothetical protein
MQKLLFVKDVKIQFDLFFLLFVIVILNIYISILHFNFTKFQYLNTIKKKREFLVNHLKERQSLHGSESS